MTRYEKRVFFEAIQRALDAISPSRKAAVLISDWIEGADPNFEWEPDRDHRARRVTKEEWRLLRNQVESHLRALSKTRPDLRDRAIRSLGGMVGLNDTELDDMSADHIVDLPFPTIEHDEDVWEAWWGDSDEDEEDDDGEEEEEDEDEG